MQFPNYLAEMMKLMGSIVDTVLSVFQMDRKLVVDSDCHLRHQMLSNAVLGNKFLAVEGARVRK